jgi:hypothetical protein
MMEMSSLEQRNYDNLQDSIRLATKIIKKEYLTELTSYPVKPLKATIEEQVRAEIYTRGDYIGRLLEIEERIQALEEEKERSKGRNTGAQGEEDRKVMLKEEQEAVFETMEKEVREKSLLQSDPGNVRKTVRLLKLQRFVFSKEEDNLQKLATVYSSINSVDGNIIMVMDSKNGRSIDFYIGVRDADINRLNRAYEVLESSFMGNFPGSVIAKASAKKIYTEALMDEVFDNGTSLSIVSGIATQRDKQHTQKKAFIQGMEKFLDSMNGKVFTAMILADSVSGQEMAEIREGYEELYSSIKPFTKSVYTFDENSSRGITDSISEGTSQTITQGITKTISHTEGKSTSVTKGFSAGVNGSMNRSVSETVAKNLGKKIALTLIQKALPAIGTVIAPGVGTAIGTAASYAVGAALDHAQRASTTTGSGYSLGGSLGYHSSRTQGTSESDTTAESRSKSTATGTSRQDTRSESTSTASGKSLQIEYSDRRLENLLERIDQQMKRLNEGEDYGMFNCCAYFISSDPSNNIVAANTYRALMVGEGAAVETSVVNNWELDEYDEDRKREFLHLTEYLRQMMHPVFYIGGTQEQPLTCTGGNIVNGYELPMLMGIPQKSVQGLPVIEQAEFGRNIQMVDIPRTENEEEKAKKRGLDSISLGNIYHMCGETSTPVKLDVNSLAMHTFITGSTGAGKSNTIYEILSRLRGRAKFLVIEPAKGEYKEILGGWPGVSVYGTNRNHGEVLRINPFVFPEKIHVLEHIDRLIEIFNVSWPMYAAMPAVLKESVEKAYEMAGWDLEESVNLHDVVLYPTFADVLLAMQKVISGTAFSQEVKDNYTGALMTRVKSMTNGINGQLFCAGEVGDRNLFDENVIVDLSRVGSMETKSLIMGILVMRLQEHRMSSRSQETNQGLWHVTVLEEAHNILKRTSSTQSSEGSNLIGKSVEMLANSIAEMRTYGEGFIIADQAPGLLDMAVIRNTNTKIIMRLPDYEDRKLVGLSIGLTENQISELTKLRTGVAVVYQNDWLEPVLSAVPVFASGKPYHLPDSIRRAPSDSKTLAGILKHLVSGPPEMRKEDPGTSLREMLTESKLPIGQKLKIVRVMEKADREDLGSISGLVAGIVAHEEAFEYARKAKDMKEWDQMMVEMLGPVSRHLDDVTIRLIIQCLLIEKAKESTEMIPFAKAWKEYAREVMA